MIALQRESCPYESHYQRSQREVQLLKAQLTQFQLLVAKLPQIRAKLRRNCKLVAEKSDEVVEETNRLSKCEEELKAQYKCDDEVGKSARLLFGFLCCM